MSLPFQPKPTPVAFSLFSEFFVAVLLAFWVSGGWLAVRLYGGPNRLVAGLLTPLWLVLALWAFVALHRAGKVRLSVSLITTIVALTAALFIGVRYA